MRLVAGPCCDRFGPRNTFAGCLLIGAIPTFLSGTANNVAELYTLRFFIGILGGSFVPCQVWTTLFFDKNIVGTANSLTAGFGNAGGGITYFLMPAIYDSLVKNQNLTPHVAWRVAFIVPGICITAVALGILFLCPETPIGKWSEREQMVAGSQPEKNMAILETDDHVDSNKSSSMKSDDPKALDSNDQSMSKAEPPSEKMDVARGEVVMIPTVKKTLTVIWSLQTLVTVACYFCSFGAELAINSILGAYYLHNFPKLGQTESGNWAAMFGLLNVVFRPAGGLVSDFLYRRSGSVWSKKIWLHSLALVAGGFLIAIGAVNSHNQSTMFGLIAGFAFFLEAGNGANFSLVPHVHPHANGVVSGLTGAAGNFGGVIFAIIFRYSGKDYARPFWIWGIVTIVVNLAISWIKPVPAGQMGGQ